ncbi:MAG: aminoacyl-tRNA hydrolase [Gaiellales bacterium]
MRWLVVGLGNPGSEYANTPHNVGFEVADAIARDTGCSLVAKHEGLFGVTAFADMDSDIALLKPLTYMNLSGRSVKPAMHQLELQPARVLVIHDEIDLPFGTLQLKIGGGLAGHNGLKSITDLLSTREFVRLRVGVGRPGPADHRPIRDWILSGWDQAPADVQMLVDSAAAAVEMVVRSGVRVAMNKVNAAGAR